MIKKNKVIVKRVGQNNQKIFYKDIQCNLLKKDNHNSVKDLNIKVLKAVMKDNQCFR